jgi:P27 family predicted phage terminase small subunit
MPSKEAILQYLKEKKLHEGVDTFLIDEFLYQFQLMEQAKEQVVSLGILVDVSSDPNKEVLQKNQAISIYESALKSALQICSKLGISPLDRKKLMVEKIEEKDGFFE